MSLPIDAHLPEIVSTLARRRNLVLAATPGAGKTTRVPAALLASLERQNLPGVIWVIEPRRIAARMAARHVAAALGEPVGRRVGYRVRFDDCTSEASRLIYMTEGLLWRCLLDTQAMRNVACVVFDEFHGRSLASDLALAALRHRQRQCQLDVQLLVMSATLTAEPIAKFLGNVPIIEVMGRAYPVTITHQAHRDKRPTEQQVAQAVGQVMAQSGTLPDAMGDILVFLAGTAEIRRAQAACAALAKAHDLRIYPLHGGLTPQEQDDAIAPCAQRKLILSTNVAETSVTIDGVSWVIDTGLAKQASQEPWSGVARLDLEPISQAAATQRAGRAGRTRPGYCLRLYTVNELARRPAQAPPEVTRFDLAEAQLWLAGLGLPPLGVLACLDAPPAEHSMAAIQLLMRLGAVGRDASGLDDAPLTLTALGQVLVQWPLHPRLGRVLYEAAMLGIARLGARAAAILSDSACLGELLRRPRPREVVHSDLSPWLYDTRHHTDAVRLMAKRLEADATHLCRSLPENVRKAAPEQEESLLSRALWAGFADRVAKRTPPLGVLPGELALQLSLGGRAYLSAQSQVRDTTFVIAVHAHMQTYSMQTRRIVQLAESVSPELLLELGGDALTDTTQVLFNSETQRVEATSRLSYDGLILEESRCVATTEQAGPVLFGVAQTLLKSRGWAAFLDAEALGIMRGRLRVAAQFSQDCRELVLNEAALLQCLKYACMQSTSFAEVREQSLLDGWFAALPQPSKAALMRLAPPNVRLAGGRVLTITYAENQAPFVSAHLQDFFGSAKGPAIAEQKLPLTLHLLAPNKRPVQLTQDLAGFWSKHYPVLKKQLSRRYPRHAWPDNPIEATPPPPHARGRKPR